MYIVISCLSAIPKVSDILFVRTNMLLTFVLQRFLFIKPNMKPNEYKSGIHSLHIKSELEGLFISINFSPKR